MMSSSRGRARSLVIGVGSILALYWIVPHLTYRLFPPVEDQRTKEQMKAEHRALIAYLSGRPPEWFVPHESGG